VFVSGLLFGLVFAAHLARLFAEGIVPLANPMFAVTSLATVVMYGRAARLLRAVRQSRANLEAAPNPPFEARPNGVALGPRGALVHDAPRGPSTTPSVPPQLER
jgi:hypothetical protein